MEHRPSQAVLHEAERTPHPRRFSIFICAALCLFSFVACNTTKLVSIESLVDAPAGVTSHLLFPTSGSSAEAYLTRPAGPGPFPLMILLHGHTFVFFCSAAATTQISTLSLRDALPTRPS